MCRPQARFRSDRQAGAGWRRRARATRRDPPHARSGRHDGVNMDFRIVIDTREKEPYCFSCAMERRALPAGDYSVSGHESEIAIERKSLVDFSHTVIHDISRFSVELGKLAVYRAACIVVEADLDRVLRGEHATELRGVCPRSLLGAALSINLRQRVPVFWCGSRPAAVVFTEQYLRMSVRALCGDVSCPKT